MKGLMWLGYRHPFLSSLGAGLVMFAIATRLGFSETIGAIEGFALAVFILVLWWPRHGVLSRRVLDWLEDSDPRVAKPDPPTS